MARTRTSDHTFRPRHAKTLVYACLLTLVLTPGAASGQEAGGKGVGLGDGPPFVECQVLSILPGEVTGLPERMAGVTVAVRLMPGDRGAAVAVSELGRHAATAAIHVRGVPG